MGIIDRLKNSWNILLFSFGLIKKDKSLIAIPLMLFILPLVILVIGFFILPILAFGGGAIYVFYAIMLFIIYFLVTFLASAHSWMVYQVMKGEDATLSSGFSRAFKNIADIIIFAVASIVIYILTSWLRGKGSIGKAAGGAIDFVAGIAKKLVLPAMIITEKNFWQASAQLKESIKAGPEIATFEIGIRPITALAFWIGAVISFLAFIIFPLAGIILFILFIVVLVVLSKFVNMTYYTIVYLTLIEKKKFKDLEISGSKLFG